ncbi:hypothetical protein MTO96_012661 [Rhipicephalus appendiculatus]
MQCRRPPSLGRLNYPAGMLIRVFAGCLLLVNTGVHCQQQSFRIRPQPVEVIEGKTVELRCEVSNQAGAVQWSKDGFVLGESRPTFRQSHCAL